MRIKFLVLLLFVSLMMIACNNTTVTEVIKQSPTVNLQINTALPPTQTQPSSGADKIVSFSKDIQPIFAQYSDSHHSAGNVYVLDTYEGVMQDVVAGNPEVSILYQRLIGDGGPVMPMGRNLPDALIKLIYDWIKQGAKNN